MKKVLLATSALVLSTGVAAAEISLSGDARMGVTYDGNEAQFSSRARVRFTFSGDTDTGLSFGATFRADQATGSAAGGSFANTESKRGLVYISGAFGRLEMGDVLSAAENALGDLSSVGFSGLGFESDIFYIVGDEDTAQGPGAGYSYESGPLGFFATVTDGYIADVSDDTHYSVAVKYDTGEFGVVLSYLDDGLTDQWLIGGTTSFAGANLKAFYSDFGGPIYDKGYGASASFGTGPVTITAYYQAIDYVGAIPNEDSYGIGAAYSLGGGATLRAGLADNYNDDTVADVGLNFSF